MAAVLDTKRSRGWLIAGVLAAWLGAGAVIGVVGDRRMEQQSDALVDAARAQLRAVDPASVPELVGDDIVGAADGRGSELERLLVVDGREPDRVAYDDADAFVARYELETWGRHAVVVVRGSTDGFEVTTE